MFDLNVKDVEGFGDELKGFHDQFHDCFLRSESRSNFYNYMAGQFSDLERKSIEPIALAIKDGNVRALQRFVSEAPWDDHKMAEIIGSIMRRTTIEGWKIVNDFRQDE